MQCALVVYYTFGHAYMQYMRNICICLSKDFINDLIIILE